MDLRHNIIDGEPREPGGRTHFSARPGEAPLWPRSGPEDVGLALDSLGGGAGPWSALGEDRRARILEAALEGLRLDPDPGGMLARAVGLQEGEFEPPELSCPPPEGPGGGGAISLVRAHAAGLLDRPSLAVAQELSRGASVLLLSDGRLPEAGERVARAFLAAGVPSDALAILHDDGEACLHAAVDSGEVGRIRATLDGDAAARLMRHSRASHRHSTFGAGVFGAPAGPELFIDGPCSVETRVVHGEDVLASARAVAASAFGRTRTLGGQRSGRVGAARVAPLELSGFTEALLEVLERRPEDHAPGRWLDPGLPDRLEALRSLGLDEGATLIHEPRGRASRSQSGRDRLLRLVFTNVEPGMRLAQDLGAAPVLLLIRDTSRDATADTVRPLLEP